jgi:hypothetical protein
MNKAATTGSARSFGASVGAKTKEFMNGSAGSELSGTSREENLPHSKFNPRYERPMDKINKHSLKHPVRPDGESVAEMVKEAAHRCALRKALTKDKPWEELFASNMEKQAGLGSLAKKSYDFLGPTGIIGGVGGVLATQDINNPAGRIGLAALPAYLASRGRGRSIGSAFMNLNKGSKNLASRAKALAVKNQILGGMGGLGGATGINTITRLANVAESDKGQDLMTKTIQALDEGRAGIKQARETASKVGATMERTGDAVSTAADKASEIMGSDKGKKLLDTAKETLSTVTDTSKDMGETLKTTAGDISRTANFWGDLGQSLKTEAKPIMDFINQHKGKFAVGSAGLLTALIYSRYQKAKEAEANAEFVNAMLEKAKRGRRRR